MDAHETVLEVRNLKKHYAVGGRLRFGHRSEVLRAVDGVSFSLERGETLGIVGESGCGKSTLARTLLRLEEPTSGEAIFSGESVFEMNTQRLKQLRRDVQIVFQDPYSSLNPRLTVEQIIAEPWYIHPNVVPTNLRQQRVRELLDSVGLRSDHAQRYPHEFSGGQRQRIGIARALALEPSLLVLDEPVSALDLSVQAQVINLLQEIQTSREIAFLFISHDLSIVRHLSDRVAVMYMGRVVEIGDTEALYQRPRHPYTKALVSAQPEVNFSKRSTERIVLSGELPNPTDVVQGCRFRTRCWRAVAECEIDDPNLVAVNADSVPGSHAVACLRPLPLEDPAPTPAAAQPDTD